MDAWLASLPSPRAFLVGGTLVSMALAGALHLGRRTVAVRAAGAAAEGFLRILVAALLLGMVFLSALQIVLRNLFDSGLLWIDPLLRHLVLVLAFAGAILATGMKRHIQINVLGRLLRGRASRVVGAAVALAAGTICLALARASLLFLADERAFGEILFLSVPSWVVACVFPAAFAAMAFRFHRIAFLELAGEAPAGAEDAAASGDAGLSGEWPILRPEERS